MKPNKVVKQLFLGKIKELDGISCKVLCKALENGIYTGSRNINYHHNEYDNLKLVKENDGWYWHVEAERYDWGRTYRYTDNWKLADYKKTWAIRIEDLPEERWRGNWVDRKEDNEDE